jgi:hypothetical protein
LIAEIVCLLEGGSGNLLAKPLERLGRKALDPTIGTGLPVNGDTSALA